MKPGYLQGRRDAGLKLCAFSGCVHFPAETPSAEITGVKGRMIGDPAGGCNFNRGYWRHTEIPYRTQIILNSKLCFKHQPTELMSIKV